MSTKIAIVGMSCRFPGAVQGPDEFWKLLEAGKDAVTQIPADRFGTDYYQHPSKREPGKSYTFSAGVLDDIAGFDAAFFGISPREAQQMDPQQRLMLELAWEAFEDAGLKPREMEGRNCGVYVGIASPDYGNRNMDDINSVDPYSATGNTLSIASNRVSYLFDLRGPSMSIDTACSSSLVALHQACQALQSGEAEMALAGGVNLLMHPFGFVTFSKASMLSPTGRCRAFDASGDGYVRSEGGAFVLLKPLDQALADGDTIHAVIAGSGVNSDGYSQGGISVPGAQTQAALLRAVYARANIDPRSLAYLEAHGTGTAVGDPIEAKALMEVAAAGRTPDNPLLIGSVKTNVGHLETASGMAGLVKAILCLKHRAVPKTLHFKTPNPRIDFAGGNLRVVDRFTPLAASDEPLVVGVNSFGFGGTNAHVVLREAPATGEKTQAANKAESTSLAPLVLSARSAQALPALAAAYLSQLDQGASWNALAAGAARRRQWLEHRAIIAPVNTAEARTALASLRTPTDELPHPAVAQGDASAEGARLALVFSGNGSQWAGMGRQLYEEEAVFRVALDEVDTLWRADNSASLVEVLREGASATWLEATENSQPLLFAIQVGVTRVLEAHGVRYDACLGHSVGEVAAAWAAGVLTLEQAVRVIRIRSRAQASTRGAGRMAAAGLSEAAARAVIGEHGLTGVVQMAGVNSPQAVTLAGSLEGLQSIGATLHERGHFFQMLDLDYAFHSSHMDAIEPAVLDGLADLAPQTGARRFVSTVTGAALDGAALDATYWWRNIREAVRFGDAVASLIEDGVRLFVEVGPHSILRTYVKQTLEAANVAGRSLATLKRQHDSASMLMHAVMTAIANGAPVDIERFAPIDDARLPLPTYPWQHEHYWLRPSAEGYNLVNRTREHPLLGYRLREQAIGWENQIDPAKLPMLADHVVDGGVAFPGAGYVEMALAAARAHFGTTGCAIGNVEIRVPVVFDPQHAKVFRLVVDPRTADFTIETRNRMSDEPWTLNVTGRLLASGVALGETKRVAPDALIDLLKQPAIDGDALYANTKAIGLSYGPAFRWIRTVHLAPGGTAALASVAIPDVIARASDSAQHPDAYALHPALMDSGFHPLFALLAPQLDEHADRAAYVPVQLGRIDYLRGEGVAYVRARIDGRSPHSVVASFEFIDAQGEIVVRLRDCRFRRVDLTGRRHAAPARYAYLLEAKPLSGELSAGSLPSPAVLVERAAVALGEKEDASRRSFHLNETLPLIDVLASAYALHTLDSLDAFDQPALPACAHPALLKRLANMLVEDGLAQWHEERLLRDNAACESLPPIDDLWRELISQSPAHVAELTLLAHCGAALPAVLRGELSGEQVLLAGRNSLVEHLFEASPTWSHVNAMMRECLNVAVDAWGEGRRLRVLELDAPDSDVLQPLDIRMRASRCDYTIAGTREQLSGFDASQHPATHTLTVDFDGEPYLGESPDADLYDFAVASRVLGASKNGRALLAALHERLSPGATIVIAEPRRSRFSDIVFNLGTDSQADARPARLSPAELTRLIEESGFDSVTRHSEQGMDLEGAPMLIVARVPQASAESGTQPARAMSRAHWSIVQAKESDAFADSVANALRSAGDEASQLVLNAATRVASMLAPRDAAPNADPRHIVFVAPDAALPGNATGADMLQSQRRTSLALARLVRDLSTMPAGDLPKLWIVTRGGAPLVAPHDDGAALRPEQATLWGLGRVLANEHPELGCRLVDIHPLCEDAASALARELLSGDIEEEVLITRQGRYVPRMVPAATAALIDNPADDQPGEATVLGFEAPGSLRNLAWFPLPERGLAADEVEIEPVATGLNFRDVMYAMGLLSDEAVESGFAGATVGMELSGRIVRVGSDVNRFAPGDEVLGFAGACFASRVRTRTTAIVHKPARLTFEEAATIPTTFFTAYYALCELARLRRGERVLIHGGAGGVGIAAIQLARHLGAEVFATAGSTEKREFVRLLGADHVFDSRSLSFADEIIARTHGAGVDIVLNSLAGEAMVRSIDTLRPFGRFLELGKRDFYENSRIGLRPFRNNISYFGIDADQLMNTLPDLTQRLFTEIIQLLADGALHPLPYRAFPAERVEEAFRYMQQARQIGKVLVTYPTGAPSPTRTARKAALALDPAAAYLVVGGTGGFGFATARRLVERGARHLVLASRTGEPAERAAAEIAQWREIRGVQVCVVACDVTNAAAVDALIDAVNERDAPLKGIVHSAMVIDDGLVRNLDDRRFEDVLAPKVAGAWNLHRATRHVSLDFFVLYSSATTFLGNPGQASYVAANTFLEALAMQRRALGLSGTFMAWGPLEDVGFLARHAETREALKARLGGLSITSDEALTALEHALVDARSGEAVVRLDWNAIARGMPAASARRYSELTRTSSSEPGRSDGENLRGRILALPRAQAQSLVEEALRAQIAHILHLSPEKIDLERSVLDMGMDSLMGMELGMAVEESFEVKLSVMALAEGATVISLATKIVESVLDQQGEGDDKSALDTEVATLAARHALDIDQQAIADVARSMNGTPARAGAGELVR
ncbi:type I polyketide synthase [Paraburkholderia hospita]|uniref:type I polyketide synthase n=1 Tax=Paraburkholderia hospita TaxID=169430 RepID=UPI0003E7EB7B|nr:type I polyketide synthase [Paraburkholderia hospita]EUC14754.1 6-deoxyerythronolide-B synthase, NADPH:quinone reductase [Burkholderia sp. BT03]SKC93992.1 Acyl transferase domain-containing protein [Paraburkholderia hospita]